MMNRLPVGGGARAHLRVAASATLLWLVSTVAAFAAVPPPVPPGATPGGALPEAPIDGVAPEVPEPSAFPVPPSIERPLDVEEGDRVFVSGFQLEGVTERLDQGIILEELQNLLEDRRAELQGLKDLGVEGFAPDEVKEIVAFMRTVVNNTELDMAFEDYQALIDKLRLEKLKREAGMTIGQMQLVANVVTEYYRSAGFVLAQAFIPAQEVSDGVVRIEVLEGRVGSVLVEGNEKYRDEVLAKPFAELIDVPVAGGTLESAILRTGDYPGLSVFAVLQPGKQVGTSDLVVRVQEEKPYEATLRFDNHGTRFTGTRRVYADMTWNNPTRAGDRLTGTLLQAYRPKNSLFGSVEYERPVFYPGMAVGGRYSRNFFEVGAEQREALLSGVSKIANLYLKHALVRQRAANVYTKVGLSRKNAVTKQDRVVVNKDNLSMVEGEVSFDSIDSESRAISLGSLGFTYGLNGLLGGMRKGAPFDPLVPPSRFSGANPDKFASNRFNKLNATFSRLQTLAENQTLLVRLEGQWSNSLLTSLEQFSIGGPASVRAYNISEYLADSGYFASLEYSINAPGFADAAAFKNLTWGEVLKVSFFTDYAKGVINSPAEDDDLKRIDLAGAGFGAHFSLPGQFTARVQVAHPIGKHLPGVLDPEAGGDPDPDPTQWWFDFTYMFQ